MDRDQQHYYTDEEVESRDTAAPEEDPIQAQPDEIDDMGFFMELLGHLRTMIPGALWWTAIPA